MIDTSAAPIPPESSDPPADPTAIPPAVDSPPFSQRPVVVPSSAVRRSHVSVAAVAAVLPIVAAASIFVWSGCGAVGCMRCGVRFEKELSVFPGFWVGLWSWFCTGYYKQHSEKYGSRSPGRTSPLLPPLCLISPFFFIYPVFPFLMSRKSNYEHLISLSQKFVWVQNIL